MPTSSPASPCGLDTSVVLRLLTGEPQPQALAAKAFLESATQAGTTVLMSDMVVAESYFALHFHYGVPKRDALQALLDFLTSGWVQPQEGGTAVAALHASLDSSAKVGFVDRLIHLQYRTMSASMVSSERAAARLERTVILRA